MSSRPSVLQREKTGQGKFLVPKIFDAWMQTSVTFILKFSFEFLIFFAQAEIKKYWKLLA